jgi:predicted alpha/beta hydrolase family esterase
MGFWKYWRMRKSDQRPGGVTKVLFIQGGGKDAHAWDAKLARSLDEKLARGYEVIFPRMPDEADPAYEAWKQCIREELKAAGEGTVLVGHSIGAAMLMKMLVEGGRGQHAEGRVSHCRTLHA